LSIPTRQLQSGALVLFTFFMISDPKTTPDSRAGRVLFACLVALGAGLVQFGLYRPNGPLYALVALSVLVPAIDRLLPDERYRWGSTRETRGRRASHGATGQRPSLAPLPLQVSRGAASVRAALAPSTRQRTIHERSLRCDP
jgi:hypothetical protein